MYSTTVFDDFGLAWRMSTSLPLDAMQPHRFRSTANIASVVDFEHFRQTFRLQQVRICNFTSTPKAAGVLSTTRKYFDTNLDAELVMIFYADSNDLHS